jgi:hypothetical protein
LIVKDRIRYCLAVFCESFCSSAAEKREYAVFCDVRQLLFCIVPFRHYSMKLPQLLESAIVFSEGEHHIKPTKAPQGPHARRRVTGAADRRGAGPTYNARFALHSSPAP